MLLMFSMLQDVSCFSHLLPFYVAEKVRRVSQARDFVGNKVRDKPDLCRCAALRTPATGINHQL